MGIGKEIRRLREAKGWTLEKLEELSGVAVGTISALENRDSSRSVYFPQLAKALGVTYEQLSGEYMPDEFVTPSGTLFVSESEPTPKHMAGVSVGPALLKGMPANALQEKYAQLLADLEDIPPSRRAGIIDQIRQAAAEAREAAAHFASRSGNQPQTTVTDGTYAFVQTDAERARVEALRREATGNAPDSSEEAKVK